MWRPCGIFVNGQERGAIVCLLVVESVVKLAGGMPEISVSNGLKKKMVGRSE